MRVNVDGACVEICRSSAPSATPDYAQRSMKRSAEEPPLPALNGCPVITEDDAAKSHQTLLAHLTFEPGPLRPGSHISYVAPGLLAFIMRLWVAAERGGTSRLFAGALPSAPQAGSAIQLIKARLHQRCSRFSPAAMCCSRRHPPGRPLGIDNTQLSMQVYGRPVCDGCAIDPMRTPPGAKDIGAGYISVNQVERCADPEFFTGALAWLRKTTLAELISGALGIGLVEAGQFLARPIAAMVTGHDGTLSKKNDALTAQIARQPTRAARRTNTQFKRTQPSGRLAALLSADQERLVRLWVDGAAMVKGVTTKCRADTIVSTADQSLYLEKDNHIMEPALLEVAQKIMAADEVKIRVRMASRPAPADDAVDVCVGGKPTGAVDNGHVACWRAIADAMLEAERRGVPALITGNVGASMTRKGAATGVLAALAAVGANVDVAGAEIDPSPAYITPFVIEAGDLARVKEEQVFLAGDRSALPDYGPASRPGPDISELGRVK